MKKMRIFLCFLSLALPACLWAEAPVVDESAHFSGAQAPDPQQNNAQTESTASTVVAQNDTATLDEELSTPLAKDNESESGPITASNNTTQSAAGLLNTIEGLRQDLQALRGQLELQANQIKQLQDQQLAFYKDIDARLSTTQPADNKQKTVDLENFTPPPRPIQRALHTNPADEQLSYLSAYDLLREKQFDAAAKAMQHFIARFPSSGYTPNAYYWLGETYLMQNRYPESIEAFEMVLKQFPNSSKAAAAQLKIGYALASSGKTHEAQRQLQEVIKNYPDTQTAQLAATKLESLR